MENGRPTLAGTDQEQGQAMGNETKRTLDVEHALQWAYRDELPKAERDGGSWTPGMPVHPMWGLAKNCTIFPIASL